MAVAKKTWKGKAHENRTKKGLRTRMGTSGKTNSTPGCPNLHRVGPGRKKKHVKRGAKGLSLSLARWGSLLFAFLDRHALTP